jgi:hypothetical protein
MIKPPIKKPIAFKEGSCKLLKPEIAWPEVHQRIVPKQLVVHRLVK